MHAFSVTCRLTFTDTLVNLVFKKTPGTETACLRLMKFSQQIQLTSIGPTLFFPRFFSVFIIFLLKIDQLEGKAMFT